MKPKEIRSHELICPSSSIAIMALAVFIVFGQLLATGHRWVEYPLFYMMNPEFSFQDWLHVYNPFKGGGYRPTAFNLYFQIVSSLFGWLNFNAFQWIAFLFQFLLGASAWWFAKKALRFDSLSCFFTGLLVSVHPVFFMLPVHLFSFDALYQIFVLIASIIWISRTRFSHLTATGFIFISLLALTSKEQAVALPCFLLWVLIYDWYMEKSIQRSFFSVKCLCLYFVILIAGMIFVSRIFYSPDGGSTYRISMDMSIILKNLVAGFFWIFRIHIFNAPTWPAVRGLLLNPFGLTLGILLLFFALVYIRRGFSSPKERRNLWIIFGLITTFFLLPVYSGGRQWHFGIPAIGAMLLSARGFTILLSSRLVCGRARNWLQGSLILLIVGCSTYELHRDQTRGNGTTRILKQAIEFPPVNSEQLPENANILYECKEPENLWAFQSIFKFVFQRRDLHEYVVTDMSQIDRDILNRISNLEDLHIFEFRPLRQPSWRDITESTIPLIRRQLEKRSADSLLYLDLSRAGSSDFEFLTGWSGPEATGRWTDGERAGLRMTLPGNLHESVVCSIQMAGYLTPRHPSTQIYVYMDGIMVRNFGLTYPQGNQLIEYRIPVPKEATDDGILEIQFHIESPARPVDVSTSEDRRQLGLFVQHIELLLQ